MSRVYQHYLTAPGCCGKAVRLRQLSGQDALTCSRNAAKSIKAEDSNSIVDFRMAELDEGVRMMLVSVTKEPAKVGDPVADSSRWEPISKEKLLDEGLEAYFTAKDVDVLRKLFSHYHEIKRDEFDDILGKAVEVSED